MTARGPRSTSGAEIAIIGVAGHYPRSADARVFWRHIREGHELIDFPSEEELLARGVDRVLLGHPRYVRAASVLETTELFDARFFGIAADEAALLDPQHRHFLECAWESLEDAGYDPRGCPGRVGVYASAAMNGYLLFNLMRSPQVAALDPLQIQLANDKDHLATRVSYKLDLRGPSQLVQSACSSSLVAVHAACQALLAAECDLALAGGAAVNVHTRDGYVPAAGGVASADGHCRSFDAAATGTVFGSGVGCVVLKPLDRALADGDHLYAVILGTAVNNDGSAKAGYAGISVEGVAAVVSEALGNAGVHPETIGYVEGHGMGTVLGDAMELQGLTRAYQAHTEEKQFCALGSVKSNVGHLDAASGITGLIKTTFALHAGVLPPTLNFHHESGAVRLASTPFYVNARTRPWPARGEPRRAGVTSLGMGGTNAHVVLEEAPALAPGPPAEPFQVLVVSARTPAALERATAALGERLAEEPTLNLADVAFTLQAGRRHFEHRRAVVVRDAADATAALAARRWITGRTGPRAVSVAFLFAGQGSQYPGMAAGLYRREPVFREAFDACAARVQAHAGLDLQAEVLEASGGEAEEALARTALTQPALLAVEYALARLLVHWGLEPAVMVGHSVGEYLAACLAGVFSLDGAALLVCERGRLMAGLPAGAMLSVPLAEAALRPLLGEGLSLAAVNAPARSVVAGPPAAVAALERRLEAKGCPGRRLRTSHAFHSAMMDPILSAFTERIAGVTRSAPRIPFFSNVTGSPIRAEEATDPGYWARHVRSPVRFSEAVMQLVRKPGQLLLEVGPGAALTGFVLQHPERAPDAVVVPTLPGAERPRDDVSVALTALARAWTLGAPVQWRRLHRTPRRRVPLPGYPFDRERFWIEPGGVPPPRPGGGR
jgi:acyl transferase domain-containing protein